MEKRGVNVSLELIQLGWDYLSECKVFDSKAYFFLKKISEDERDYLLILE